MAKFCGNCGSQQPDNARVCGNCGAPFAAPAPTRPATRPVVNSTINPAKKANLVKWGKLAAMALAAVIVIGLLIGILSGAGSPKSVAKKAFKAMANGREKKIVSLMTNMYTKDEKKDYAELLVDGWEDLEYKVKSVKVDDVDKLDKDDLKDAKDVLKDRWEDMEDWDKDDWEDAGLNRKFKPNKIKAIATVTLEVTYKDEDGDKDEMDVTVYMFKEGASWKVVGID